jgi:hypothetical protein
MESFFSSELQDTSFSLLNQEFLDTSAPTDFLLDIDPNYIGGGEILEIPPQPIFTAVQFASGELESYVQAPYEPYNPYPNSGIVTGTGPDQITGYVGDTITLPSKGGFQMVERKAIFVNSGGNLVRQIPDQIVYPDFVGWTDGNFIYSAGSSYVIPNPALNQNVILQGVWRTLTYSPQITSFTPLSGRVGDKITIVGKRFASVDRITFRNSRVAQFTIINDNLIEAIVPAGTVNGRITARTYALTSSQSSANFTIVV